ncbi:MAG: hypothetical protein ACTSQP_12155 [Promethearchaeota archaeon]
MDFKKSIIIASTLHEPKFRLKAALDKALPFIKKNLENIIVSCTSLTSREVLNYLEKNNFKIIISSKDDRIETYLEAIKFSKKIAANNPEKRILYVDFDRLIHWINNYPDELIETLKKAMEVDLLHIGRSKRAFSTHPNTQQKTERIINSLCSKALNFTESRDIISVCYSFTPHLADRLLDYNYKTEMGFYCLWPIILWINANNKLYIEVEGQEWETPDRFEDEIKKLGYNKWLQNFQSSSEWEMRVKLLEDCIEEFTNFVNFSF